MLEYVSLVSHSQIDLTSLSAFIPLLQTKMDCAEQIANILYFLWHGFTCESTTLEKNLMISQKVLLVFKIILQSLGLFYANFKLSWKPPDTLQGEAQGIKIAATAELTMHFHHNYFWKNRKGKPGLLLHLVNLSDFSCSISGLFTQYSQTEMIPQPLRVSAPSPHFKKTIIDPCCCCESYIELTWYTVRLTVLLTVQWKVFQKPQRKTQMNKHVYKSENLFMCLEGQRVLLFFFLWGITSTANITECSLSKRSEWISEQWRQIDMSFFYVIHKIFHFKALWHCWTRLLTREGLNEPASNRFHI